MTKIPSQCLLDHASLQSWICPSCFGCDEIPLREIPAEGELGNYRLSQLLSLHSMAVVLRKATPKPLSLFGAAFGLLAVTSLEHEGRSLNSIGFIEFVFLFLEVLL